jgi:hypothetical protein
VAADGGEGAHLGARPPRSSPMHRSSDIFCDLFPNFLVWLICMTYNRDNSIYIYFSFPVPVPGGER